MKTTFELPDALFREAKSVAAARDQTLRQFFTEAIREKLMAQKARVKNKPWMKHYGACKSDAGELRRLDRIIAAEFETIDPRDWE